MKNQKSDGTKLEELINYQGPDQVISSYDLTEILKQTSDSAYLLDPKIPRLKRYLEGGFESGELIVISGPPKMGKTLLGQTFTWNFLDKDKKSLWFQYEVTPRRFLASFPDIPLFYLPQELEANALHWLKQRTIEAIVKHGVAAVFIDHLHYLFDIAAKGNASLQIGQVVRYLKRMAVDLNIVVFLLCHMKKVTFDKEPSDEDIRDSSLIGGESDTVLILWRLKDENQAIIKLMYARRSGERDRKIKLQKVNGLLYELSE